ncbi:sugar ABC transporter ATP-binding protein [Clostridium thermopalmarium]|uniref:Ribose import ATP-binding protein RbsA n=1 Tax=Clostridium thermopalmarium DSM 5974 TaxID=1121340 RepID=A0A2T0ANN5_9CLOT|nr:sugar ABC transporter ATP-binding protein [Clostridium thermopalmarium]MBE6044249.1 sugar ABC transporter ATP-binding protein [Clostridium thermopalmarium]PRR70572.1 Ribose import ATP-binding protein RbsA [Clostridium thermopalmarium DSM 5974]PVZ21698.1 ribose transport system ATP-binding protein [Clostridium thermopalmarium DSM 5974]
MNSVFLKMENIHKRFPGVYALKNVNLEVRKGEVHGLLGENGAGKSTLMKILGGVHAQDEGKVYVEGVDCGIITPSKAVELGIGFVHQELNLAESLTVAENVYMGRLPYKNKALGIVDYKKLYEDTDKIIKKLGINIKPTDIVGELETAKKQMVEIAKAISLNAKIIIFDEPTTSLSNKDVANLFKVIETLKSEGVASIYISHRLNEIFDICDRATVLRDGTFIGTCEIKEISQEKLINMMVGRELKDLFPKEIFTPGEVVLETKDLCDTTGKIKNINIKARKGEILGIAGLVGSGRSEVMRLIFGADPIGGGEIKINGNKVKIKSPEDAIKNGICLLTEDRKKQGLSLIMSVADNITITSLKNFFLDHKALKEVASKYVNALRIKTSNLDTMAGTLSGGNQQKIVLAKWLNTNSDIFIFDEPTKGIDVGAKAEIYDIMNDLVRKGKVVIMISSELPELLGMSDRVYVMCEGRITGELNRDEATQEKIMELATVGGADI